MPEQGGGFRRRQYRLRLDAALELLVQPLNGIGGACRSPLTIGQTGEGEQPVSGFLQVSATARHFSRHLRMNDLRRVSISFEVPA